MIPYEDLERALARWKSRKSGTVESPAAPPDADATPAAPVAVVAAIAARDSTGELDLTEAELDET